MGPARSVSRALAALTAGAVLSVSTLGRAESEQDQIQKLSAELAATKSELTRTQSALAALERKVDALGAAPPAVSAAADPVQSDTARIAPVNADNPAISFVVDVQGGANTQGDDGVGF